MSYALDAMEDDYIHECALKPEPEQQRQQQCWGLFEHHVRGMHVYEWCEMHYENNIIHSFGTEGIMGGYTYAQLEKNLKWFASM